MGRKKYLHPQEAFGKNLAEVNRLLEIHREVGGVGPGYKHNLSVLNKSAIVLLLACWESFVEDLAETAFSVLLNRSKAHTNFSMKVLISAGRPLKESKDEREVWKLAGDGWKSVLKKHKVALLEKYTGRLNSPGPKEVDSLYSSLLGIGAISSNWKWNKMTPGKARKKLRNLVDLRGSIAHRVGAARKVLKKEVNSYGAFINRIAVRTSNATGAYVTKNTGKQAWPQFPE